MRYAIVRQDQYGRTVEIFKMFDCFAIAYLALITAKLPAIPPGNKLTIEDRSSVPTGYQMTGWPV